jgi:hypothetical protein
MVEFDYYPEIERTKTMDTKIYLVEETNTEI